MTNVLVKYNFYVYIYKSCKCIFLFSINKINNVEVFFIWTIESDVKRDIEM